MPTSIERSQAPVDADAHRRGLGRTGNQMQLCRREAHAYLSARRAKHQPLLLAHPTPIQLVVAPNLGPSG